MPCAPALPALIRIRTARAARASVCILFVSWLAACASPGAQGGRTATPPRASGSSDSGSRWLGAQPLGALVVETPPRAGATRPARAARSLPAPEVAPGLPATPPETVTPGQPAPDALPLPVRYVQLPEGAADPAAAPDESASLGAPPAGALPRGPLPPPIVPER